MATPLPRHRWTRLIPAQWEDAWIERLAWVGRDRVCVVQMAGQKRLRLEVYPATLQDGRKLVKEFGGKLGAVRSTSWLAASQPRRPLRMTSKLWIADSPETAARLRKTRPEATVLSVPASMAFGTGEHATTGMLGRRLARLPLAGASVCDAGTGSGLLALVARVRGAKKIEAFDFDATAVRIARENEKSNFPGPAKIRWSKKDVTRWSATTVFDVVVANLYAELLIHAVKPLTDAVRPGGVMLLSGILLKLEKDVTAPFLATGLRLIRRQRKGKWVMLELEKPSLS